MKKRTATLAGIGMLLLILDSKTAIMNAQTALSFCLETIVPALFPFFILSSLLLGSLSPGFLRPIGRICRIPAGAEPILMIGLLGGYPAGAQCIYQSFQANQISKKQAERLLAFCNNAGPSFIFGVLSRNFSTKTDVLLLWVIHIIGAIIVGAILPPSPESTIRSIPQKTVTVADALQTAIRTTALVSGWIILFKIVIGFCSRWFLWLLPRDLQILLYGVMELSNGCLYANEIVSQTLRFWVCEAMLSFGGICVAMQTTSVCAKINCRYYFAGKVLQTGICTLLAYPVAIFRFGESSFSGWFVFLAFIFTLTAMILFRKNEIYSSISRKAVV